MKYALVNGKEYKRVGCDWYINGGMGQWLFTELKTIDMIEKAYLVKGAVYY